MCQSTEGIPENYKNTYETMLNAIDAMMYVSDIVTGEILYANEKMCACFSTDGKLTGKVCWEAFRMGLTARCENCSVPWLLAHPGETRVWESASPINNRSYRNYDKLIPWTDGRTVMMQHSIDITEVTEAHEQISTQIAELRSAKQAAESASNAKSDFLARMSHEIRTPLNAIIGMTSIAKSTRSVSRKDYCLDHIDSASHHLLSVINDILDMSKIESEQFALASVPFDFEKMLMNTINMIQFRIDEKDQNLLVDLDPRIPTCITSDEQRLSQVIANLLLNANKFSPEGSAIHLNVCRLADECDDIVLQFSVKDHGIGISLDQQSLIFQSFEQLDGSRSRSFGGTGLGLVISKHIVEMLGGSISVESEPGMGATFTFTAHVRPGDGSVRARSNRIKRRDMRILLVDDSKETREYVKNLMDELCLPCDVAKDGEEALCMIARRSPHCPYNVFFVDWLMPGMDGIELTRRIKELAPEESVVIMISAARWSDIQLEAIAAGADRFIPKPLFPSALVDCLNECVGIDPPQNDACAEPDQPLDLRDVTILLVEDVAINREIVSALLEDTGVNIDMAENGCIAVDLCQDHLERYSLIFMDIHMPHMDGLEATERIRQLDHSLAGEIPIIAMTANAFLEDIERCLQAGMNDHIAKPLDNNLLIEKMKQYLAR